MATLPEPEFAEVERPLQEHFKSIGIIEGIELFTLDHEAPAIGSQWPLQPGLYGWDEDEQFYWRICVGHDAQQRRLRWRELRDKAAKMSADATAAEFTPKANAVFEFLKQGENF